MKHVVGAFSALLVLVLNIFICVTLGTVSADAAAAKEYKADVIAEIENSNFNPNVIAACISQAHAAGYELTVRDSAYDADGNVQSAEVVLSYTYQMPLFGIRETKTTRGVAR